MTTTPFGYGSVSTSATGAVLQFKDHDSPQRKFLLDSTCYWHSPAEHTWGSGLVTTNVGSGRWNANKPIRHGGGIEFKPLPEVLVKVDREYGDTLVEAFSFTNTSEKLLDVTGLGIQVPFGDLYNDSETSLNHAIHAHVFTGGSWSWVLAQPMSGNGKMLGLIVRTGEFWSYSIESRNIQTGSNVRGHLVLNVTDHVHNPSAFGGQPVFKLAPGASYQLSWDIGWYDTLDAFLEATRPPAQFSSYAIQVGSDILLTSEVPPSTTCQVRSNAKKHRLGSSEHGIHHVDIGKARTALLFHEPLKQIVHTRCAYILRHQRAHERQGLLAHAFVPVDTRTLLRQATNGWSDWSDGSERIAMPILLQLAAMRGWTEEPKELELWAQFARHHLLDDQATPRRGSQDSWSGARLYDTPWLAQFFNDRYQLHGRLDDLHLAASILEKAFSLGMKSFLAITLSETVVAVIHNLKNAGQAKRLSKLLLDCAYNFASAGTALPKHEVNYEQSMVGPLLNLFIDAYNLSGDQTFLTAIERSLPWLLAFSGPQPHVRLHGIAIRHWDGFWFGTNRLWGDVFPHYWSTITSMVLLRLPKQLKTPETNRIASAILKSNLSNYRADGSATCAFVMPSAVDGRAAHCEDSQANDQDWHLVFWLRLLERGLVDEEGFAI